MYNTDDSDKGSDYEECLDKSINITKKSLSCIGFRYSPEMRYTGVMALRPTQSLSEKLHDLKLDIRMGCNPNTFPTLTTCPCGCFLRPPVPASFATREKDTFALYVFSADILNYHGCKFKPNQIAPLWKKDCRKFLWKNKS